MNPNVRVRRGWILAAWGAGAVSALLGAERFPALSPAEALQAFKLEPGLRIELVAAEPTVVDPVAIAFDEQRRLFVVENRGYPGAVKKNQAEPDPVMPAAGRIVRLEDRDGNGTYERRTEFATDLTFPNGILPWRGGVFVTCAPDILYLKDTDGDGIADERKVVLTGFSTTRTTQIRVSHPILGLDGKVYVTCGLNGGKVTSPLYPERPVVSFANSDGRFDPETFAFEAIGGRAQFGQTFDAYGRRFICSNRHPVMHVVLEPGQLRRNPHLAFAETVQNVSKVEAEAAVWPISHASVTADFIPALMSKPHTGTFTSASGVFVYGGSALGPEYVGNVFICESAQNLVQRQVLRPAGATFAADPATVGRDFLATTDVWFRPVFLGDGTDGGLYVVDMNRREIDHPSYVPEESRGKFDFVSGNDRGRIYRITRAGLQARPRPAELSTADLVRELEAPEAWWRELAQRLLVARADFAAVPEIERRATGGSTPEARTRALWTLAGLGKLNPRLIATALRDPAAGVREQGLGLAAPQLEREPALAELALAAATDADARVRFQAALVLGAWPDPRAVAALAVIAARDGADRWARVAVLSGIGSRLEAFRGAFALHQAVPAAGVVLEELGRLIGAGAPLDDCKRFLQQALDADAKAIWRVPAVLGLAEGLRNRAEFKGRPIAAALAAVAPAGPGEDGAGLQEFFRQTLVRATDERTPLELRSSAIAVLGYTEFAQGVAGLGALLDARQPPELQLQVVRALDRAGNPRGAEMLVEPRNWSRYTPQIREAVIAALASKPAMIRVLFAAIKRGDLKAAEISSVRRKQLLKHTNAELRREAAALFESLEGGDRMAVYREYRAVLDGPADAAGGAAVFVRVCSACHTHRGTGGKVGPDLTGVRNQPADALLLHILVPNYEVAPAYQAITVTTQDGRAVAGWLAAETEGSVTLRTAFGTEETVLRKSIAALAASGVSLMPDGLEQTMTRPELAALIAFLKSDPAGTP